MVVVLGTTVIVEDPEETQLEELVEVAIILAVALGLT